MCRSKTRGGGERLIKDLQTKANSLSRGTRHVAGVKNCRGPPDESGGLLHAASKLSGTAVLFPVTFPHSAFLDLYST